MNNKTEQADPESTTSSVQRAEEAACRLLYGKHSDPKSTSISIQEAEEAARKLNAGLEPLSNFNSRSSRARAAEPKPMKPVPLLGGILPPLL